MIVVSDTSPINYLVLIERVNVLHELFGRVIVPEAVYRELTLPDTKDRSGTPEVVRQWVLHKPDWLEVLQIDDPQPFPGLDPGETEAINLALSLKADVLLIDEDRGREAAKAQGLIIAGTVGVLERADIHGLLRDLPGDIGALLKAGYRIREEIIDTVLERYEQRLEKRQELEKERDLSRSRDDDDFGHEL